MSGDLHCHTRLSDGSMGLEEIIALAVSNGVDTLAVTDHDCLAGTTRAKMIGDRNGIRVITGVELSALDKDTNTVVHILCYQPEYPDRLEGLCKKNAMARKRASQYIMVKVAQKYPVTADLMKRCAQGSTCLYKQHIMHALMECGLSGSIYGEVHDLLFREGENCVNVIPRFASVEEVLKTVHDADGIAVLAHPALYNDDGILEKYTGAGLDGIEVWHPSADEETTARLTAYAKKHKLLMTGGSDFHGLYNKTAITLGSCSTPKQQLTELLAYKSKQKRLQKKLAKSAEENED